MIQGATLALFGLMSLVGLINSAWALALLMTMFAFEQVLQASSDMFRTNLWLTNVFVAMVVGVSAVRVVITRARPFFAYFTPIWWGCIGIYAWSAVSLVWSPSSAAAWDMISWALPYVTVFLIAAPFLVQGVDSVGTYSRTLLYGGTLVVLFLVLNPEFSAIGGRLGFQIEGSTRSSPLAIGELGGTLIIVASLLRQGPNQALLSVARAGAFILGAVLALQSGSRGQLLFAVLVALAFYPLSKRLKSIPAFFGTVLGLIIIVPAILYLGQAVLLTEGSRRWDANTLDEGLQVRLANAWDLIAVFLTSPAAWIFGLGANAFTSISAKTASEGYVHNITVETICELGIPAFALFVTLIVFTLRNGIWLFRRFANEPISRASISVLLALAAYQLLLINKQGSLWGDYVTFLYFILIARLRLQTEDADQERAEENAQFSTDADQDEALNLEDEVSESTRHPAASA